MKKLLLTLTILTAFALSGTAQNIWKPITCDTPLLGAASNGDLYAMGGYSGLLRSQDEGETWQVVLGHETGFSGYFNQHCFAVSNEGRICVFNDNQQSVVYSDDDGATWQQTPTISSCAMPDKTGLCAPTNDIFVVWAEEGEIAYSIDGGATWEGWIPDFMNADNGPAINDLLVNENGDVYLGVSTLGGEGGIFHSTLSDIQSWELVAAEGINIMDMAFDPEGNVVACGWRTEGSVDFQHTPGFYVFGGTSLAIGDGGIVYTPHFIGLQAILSYSTDHGEHFTEIGEHLPLVDIAPGGDNAHLFKGTDNHLYFDGGGEYWKSISDADHILNYNYVPLVHEGNDRQKRNVVFLLTNSDYPNDYFTEIQSIRDDIVLDGVDYKLVWTESVHQSKGIAGAVREENKKVYFRRYLDQSYEDEVLLYDFNLAVGDTVTVGQYGETLMLMEVSEVEVNGAMRRKYGFGDPNDGVSPYSEIYEYWIEGVGSNYGFLNSGYESWVGSFIQLLCYHENGNLIWDNEEFDDCVMNSDGAPAAFAPQGAEWYFDVTGYMSSPIDYYHMEVLGDTLIQGHQCSVITRQYMGGNGNEQFVYEDNGVVYWYNQTIQGFTTLYDFNAEEEESWICDIDSCSFEVRVESVGEVTWEGHTYRVQNVVPIVGDDYNGEPFFWGGGQIIEGIGAVGLFPNSWVCSASIVCGPYPDYLRCYLVNGEMLYHEGEYDCDEYGYCWDGTIAEAYAGGHGTEENPYQIKTSKQLALLVQQTNEGAGGDAYYELIDDINLKNCITGGMVPWTPIGTTTHAFTGHFNGNGHVISNLYQNIADSESDHICGLFGCTDGAEIVNVNLSDCSLTGGEYAGGLVGYAGRTTISGCRIESSTIESVEGTTGGLVGYMGVPFGMTETNEMDACHIVNCQALSTVEVRGYRTGGIVGEANANALELPAAPLVPCFVEHCYNFATVTSTGTQVDGTGVAGGVGCWMISADMTDCVNYGTVTAYEAGGVAGMFSRAQMTDCKNHGSVHGMYIAGGIMGCLDVMRLLNTTSALYIIRDCHNYGEVLVDGHPSSHYGMSGGIVGYFLGGYEQRFSIVDCSNQGNVSCYSTYFTEFNGYAGGILGRHTGSTDMKILNAYNTGTITSAAYAGGMVGSKDPVFVIRNVYNGGDIVSDYPDYSGGIIGTDSNSMEMDTISHCYWLYNTEGTGGGASLPHSCAFWPTTYYGEWSLDSLQFGQDLVTALNADVEEINDLYPEIGPVTRWKYDDEEVNGGFPVFDNTAGVLVFHGSEWYYEIENENGSITYQHLQQVADTTVSGKDVTIIIRTNTLYDKSEHTEVTREFVYEENNVVYWWNPTLEEFTVLYDLGAQPGDSWVIKVGTESITMHVDAVENIEYDGNVFRTLLVSDENDLFSGTIVCGIGHLTSFFPERLMTRGKNYRVDGMRCYWRNGELVFKYGGRDCDEVYKEWHNGIEETEGSFAIYPNPTNGVLVVETQNFASLPDQTYRISNLMGQTLMSGTITAETQRIDLSNLPQGMYFITIGNSTKKVVVNK